MSISTLNMMYHVLFTLTVVFFILAVVFFFVFDIRHVFAIRTGRAAKRDIEKMREQNSKTGRLTKKNATDMYGQTGNFGDSEEFGKTEKVSGTGEIKNNKSGNLKQSSMNGDLNPSVIQSSETTVLGNQDTTVLGFGETTVLNGGGTSFTKRKFDIIKKEIYIHTEERI